MKLKMLHENSVVDQDLSLHKHRLQTLILLLKDNKQQHSLINVFNFMFAQG